MIVLVDIDNVVANFELGFLETFRMKYPEQSYVPLENRSSLYLEDDYPESVVYEILLSKGFFRSLPVMPGAISGVSRLASAGYDVFFCTSPTRRFEHCVPEKLEWIETHFGTEWLRKTIITCDKLVVAGDILIDDRPEFSGCREPLWEHIVYDQAFNRHISNKRRMTWQSLTEVFPTA